MYSIIPGSSICINWIHKITCCTIAKNPNVTINTPIHFTNTSYNTSSYIWVFGDGTTSNLVNPVYAYTTPGNYTVQLNGYNANGCNAWNEIRHYITVTNSTGIAESYNDLLNVKIQPNPARNECTITFNTANIIKNISAALYNIDGKFVSQLFKDIALNGNQYTYKMNLKSIPPGLYLIKTFSTSGSKISKLIVY